MSTITTKYPLVITIVISLDIRYDIPVTLHTLHTLHELDKYHIRNIRHIMFQKMMRHSTVLIWRILIRGGVF